MTTDWSGTFPELDSLTPEAVVPVPYRLLLVKNCLATSSVVVRWGVLQRAGEFDLSLHGPEDNDLWLRVASLAPVANLSQPLTGYRSVAGSLSKQAVSMRAGMWRILIKLDERRAWGGDCLLRRKAYGYCDYSCAYMYSAGGDQVRALTNVLRSLLWYPLPYRPGPEVKTPFARVKLLASIVGRLGREAVSARELAASLSQA